MEQSALITVGLDEIEATSAAALTAHGATTEVAGRVARAIRIAEATNNRICGLYYLESYCRQLRSGRVSGAAEPVVTNDRSGAVRVDAKYGFAQQAFAVGFDAAVAAARTNGMCGYSVEHSHTCTSLGFFTEQFAEVGLIAIGMTNASARVAPPGGSKALLGTNPIAMAVPARDGGVGFQFDFSTSAIALGKITMAAAADEPIPLGWAVDEHGEPTTDPHAALKGSLVSAGGYKGYAIGLMVEVLASALTGSVASPDVGPLKAPTGDPHDLGQFYIVIDPTAYSGDRFWDGVELLAERVDGQPGARLPGAGRELPEEVELDAELWAATQAFANVS